MYYIIMQHFVQGYLQLKKDYKLVLIRVSQLIFSNKIG